MLASRIRAVQLDNGKSEHQLSLTQSTWLFLLSSIIKREMVACRGETAPLCPAINPHCPSKSSGRARHANNASGGNRGQCVASFCSPQAAPRCGGVGCSRTSATQGTRDINPSWAMQRREGWPDGHLTNHIRPYNHCTSPGCPGGGKSASA